jgi:hypothetical protein
LTAPAAETIFTLIAQSSRSLRSLETEARFGRNTLARIVAGKHPARRSTVERLAAVLAVDPEALAASLARARASYLTRARALSILRQAPR